MKCTLFIFLSFSLYSQVTLPDVIADSVLYEVKLGRQCVRLDSANRVQIATLEAMVSGQARLITLERSQISEYKAKEDLWQLQFENQAKITGVEKSLLKTKIRALRRWLTVSVAGNVILVVVLIAL